MLSNIKSRPDQKSIQFNAIWILCATGFFLTSFGIICFSSALSFVVYIVCNILNIKPLRTERNYIIQYMNEFTEENSEFTSIWIDNKIHVLHYDCKNANKKTPILLVHGTNSFSINYVEYAKKSVDRDFFILDVPGWGISEWFNDCDSVREEMNIIYERYKETLVRVIEYLSKHTNNKKWIFHGHSLGGFMGVNTLFLTNTFSDEDTNIQIEHYYLSNIPGLYNVTNYGFFWGYILTYALPEIIVKNDIGKYLCLLPLYLFRHSSPLVKCRIANLYNKTAVNGARFCARHMERTSMTTFVWVSCIHDQLIQHDAGNITLIYGENDTVTESYNGEKISILTNRRIKIHIIPNYGHQLLNEEVAPQIFNIIKTNGKNITNGEKKQGGIYPPSFIKR